MQKSGKHRIFSVSDNQQQPFDLQPLTEIRLSSVCQR